MQTSAALRSPWTAFALLASLGGCLDAASDAGDGAPPGGPGDGAIAAPDGAVPRGDGGDPSPPPDDLGPLGPLESGVPAFGGSSHGTGGAMPAMGVTVTIPALTYLLIAPGPAAKAPLPLLVYVCGISGCPPDLPFFEGLGGLQGLDGVRILAEHTCTAEQIAYAMDDVRAKYDIDNDRTYLQSESAGTSAGLALGFGLRQGWFAAYWVNDLVTWSAPQKTAAQLGFRPWGSAGPGGNFAAAMSVVDAMQAAGYRLPDPTYYDGPGAGTHGDPGQAYASVMFYAGKSRQ